MIVVQAKIIYLQCKRVPTVVQQPQCIIIAALQCRYCGTL